jgi:predicted SprT family Zn-dependent metalloprotease
VPWLLSLFDYYYESLHPARTDHEPRPSAETVELESCWRDIRKDYFPHRPDIDNYIVKWSGRRQTQTLASCNIERRVVRVSSLMKERDAVPYLEALLYHEMCHAVVGPIKVRRGRRIIHGREFKALEHQHSGIKSLNRWIESGGWTNLVRRAEQRRCLVLPK